MVQSTGMPFAAGEVAVEDNLLQQPADAKGGDEGEGEIEGTATRGRGHKRDERANEHGENEQRQPNVGEREGQRAGAGQKHLERSHEQRAVGECERGHGCQAKAAAPREGGREGFVGEREAVDGLAGLVAREVRVVGDLLCGLERCVK